MSVLFAESAALNSPDCQWTTGILMELSGGFFVMPVILA